MNPYLGRVAYVSYSRAAEKRDPVVAKLVEAFSQSWVQVGLKIDTDVVKARDNFEDFIDRLAAAPCVVMVFSEKYFNSFYCMLELARTVKHLDAASRIYPIYANGFRLDKIIYNETSCPCMNTWQQKLSNWNEQMLDENEEANQEEANQRYGSKAEYQEIVDSIGKISEVLDNGRKQTYDISKYTNDIVEQVKKAYSYQITQAPGFSKISVAAEYYREQTRTLLAKQIKATLGADDRNTLQNDMSSLIAVLAAKTVGEVIKLFSRVQKLARQELSAKLANQVLDETSSLIQHLMPQIFCPDETDYIKGNVLSKNVGLHKISFEKDIAAEFIMAGAERRPTDFKSKQGSSVNLRNVLFPGRFRLQLGPENGPDTAQQSQYDFDEEIAQRLANAKGSGKIATDIDKYLYDEVAITERKIDPSGKDRQESIADELKDLRDEFDEGFYWVLKDDNQGWLEVANHINERYPEITLLCLIGGDLNERKLLRPVHNIIAPLHEVTKK